MHVGCTQNMGAQQTNMKLELSLFDAIKTKESRITSEDNYKIIHHQEKMNSHSLVQYIP